MTDRDDFVITIIWQTPGMQVCADPNELSLLLALIAIGLSEGLNADELNAIGNVVITIGTIMVTISSLMVVCDEAQKAKQGDQKKCACKQQIDELQKQIDLLKAKCP